MIYVHWLVLVIYFVLCIGTVIAVLLDRKEPVKTFAWLLLLCYLPVIGIILYFFFGQNTRKRLLRRQTLSQLRKQSLEEFQAQDTSFLPQKHRGLLQMFVHQDMALPFCNNDVEIFSNGDAFFSSLLSALSTAEKHIHLETYIFENDEIGNRIADILRTKARQGVEVRLLYDDVGCWRVPKRFFEQMRLDGVEAKSFLPVFFPLFTSKMNYRNHRKICVIDGKKGYIGGMNIADRYIHGNNGTSWTDLHLCITGNAVYGIQSVFLQDWFYMDRTLLSGKNYYPSHDGISNDCCIQIVTSSCADKWPNIMQGYIKILNQAHQYVYMETPYFLPTQEVISAMQIAALSGVDVRIIIPEKGDNTFVEQASRSFFPEVQKSGVKIYLYKAGFNHSKLLVCDDEISSVGSANIDSRSFENNMEVNAIIYNNELALQFKEIFLSHIKESQLMNPQQMAAAGPPTIRNFVPRLWQSIIRMLSPLF